MVAHAEAAGNMGLVLSSSTADQRRLVRRAEAAEEESRSRADLFTAVVEALDDGVVVVDGQGDVVATNRAAAGLMEAMPGSARVGEAEVLYPDGSPVPASELPSAQALRSGRAEPRDLVVHERGRRTRVLSVSATRLADTRPFGSGPGAVIVHSDVTSERDGHDALASFASTVAHDLRGPLAALRSWIELCQLASTSDPDLVDLPAWLAKAVDAADAMGSLVDELLEHAENGDGALTLVPVDLTRVAAEVATLHGVRDLVRVETLPTVLADEVLVRQLFANLLGNAAKYVAPGVVPRVRVEGTAHEREVEITVTDNGIGIPEALRRSVFDRFLRAHPSRHDIPGHGLGLALCRSIVERHGGSISIATAPDGHGSRFTVVLPSVDPASVETTADEVVGRWPAAVISTR